MGRPAPSSGLGMLALYAAVLAAVASTASATAARPPPPPPSLSFVFDAPFGSNMVLQHAPARAAVYGYMDAAGTSFAGILGSDDSDFATVQAIRMK